MSAIPAIPTMPSPPGPRVLPIIVNLHHLWGADAPHIAVSKVARRYSDVVQFRLGNPPMVALSHPGYIPFGVGHRRCTGDHLAVCATRLHTARIPRCLRLDARRRFPAGG